MGEDMPGNGKRRNRYDDEFKRSVVRELINSGEAVTVFARHAGIEQSVLHRWVKRFSKEVVLSEHDAGGDLCGIDTRIRGLAQEVALIRENVSTLRTIVEKAFGDRYCRDLSQLPPK